MSALQQPVVILDRPQLAENIGAAARAMANFGLQDLRLVRPRDGWPQERAYVSSSGATWPLDGVQLHETVADAVGDLRLVLAATARPRETALPVLTSREGAARLSEAVSSGWKVGMLFGGERAGLATSDVALCHGIVTIPVDPSFHSLNLAQAVAVLAYEWRLTQEDRPSARFKPVPPPAETAALVGFYEHLERELDAAGFFFPPENKPSMVRNLRVALGRARLTDQEVRSLRGVITALVKGRGGALARQALEEARRANVPK